MQLPIRLGVEQLARISIEYPEIKALEFEEIIRICNLECIVYLSSYVASLCDDFTTDS